MKIQFQKATVATLTLLMTAASDVVADVVAGGGSLRGSDSQCVARCKRLRFGASRRDACIRECNDAPPAPAVTTPTVSPTGSTETPILDEFSSGDSFKSDTATFEGDEATFCPVVTGNGDCCPTDWGVSGDDYCCPPGASIDADASPPCDFGVPATGGITGEMVSCEKGCKRKRWGGSKMEQCIAKCYSESEPRMDEYDDNEDMEEVESKDDYFIFKKRVEGANPPDDVAACERSCQMKRWSKEKAEQCVTNCHGYKDATADSEDEDYSFSNKKNERKNKKNKKNQREDSSDVMECKRRCGMKRYAQRMVDQCKDNCEGRDIYATS